MKYTKAYTDNNNDLNLRDVEDYSDEYYENQPGDAISTSTNHRRTRKKNPLALGLLAIGTLLVIGGIIFAVLGKNKERASSKSASASAPEQAPVPTAPLSPAPAAGKNEAIATLEPTHSTIYDFIATLVGETILQDTNSLAYRALSWLETQKDQSLGNARLQQRFALACLYLSTTQKSSWVNSDGWMSESDECTWYGIECKHHRLISLNLTDNGLEGLVPWEISFLKPNLLSLELSRNHILNEGQELAWIGQLTNLRMLDIEHTYMSYNGIPPYISKLTQLKILDISETLFVGDLDGSIFAPLTQLVYLEMGGNLYNTTLPQEIVNLPSLEALYAYENGLEGDLTFLRNLTKIVELWLDGNSDISGTIPSDIGLLTNLMSLSITHCDLWGQIPTEIGKLTLMEQMWFYGNWLSGSIPTEIVGLPNLKILGLEDNNITDVAMPQGLCEKDMIALSADCGGEYDLVECSCCTCCESPCPVVNLPTYDNTRLLQMHEEIRKL